LVFEGKDSEGEILAEHAISSGAKSVRKIESQGHPSSRQEMRKDWHSEEGLGGTARGRGG